MTAIVQNATVTLTSTNDLYVEVTPAINTTKVQQVGLARVGDNQTVTVQPVE